MKAKIYTSLGIIEVVLFDNYAPRTVSNFIKLAKSHIYPTAPGSGDCYYSYTLFHRVIPDFIIQGGSDCGELDCYPGYFFDDEIHPDLNFQLPYVLAMANHGLKKAVGKKSKKTRKGRGTNGSQFFITTEPTPWLQGRHTIFGEVVDEESQQVVHSIARVPTGLDDKPLTPVVITKITISD